MEKRKVPALSLSSYTDGSAAQKSQFIDDLYNSFFEFGFVVIKDHPIDADLLEHAYELSEEFFSLPEATKKGYVSKIGGGQRGYTAFGKEHAKDRSVADLKEFWHVGRELKPGHPLEKLYPPNIWPEEVVDFRRTFTRIYAELENAGQVLLQALTLPLEVPADYFDKMIRDGNSILRLLHYPPIPAGTDPKCLRAAPHEDINLITLLVSATASGLQLKDKDGTWLDVESDPNTLVVNMGDMLSRMTNDVLPSTTHQVVNVDTGRSRYSMPFFLHPNPEALLTCFPKFAQSGRKYPDISSHDFLMQRLREIGLY